MNDRIYTVGGEGIMAKVLQTLADKNDEMRCSFLYLFSVAILQICVRPRLIF